MSCGSTIRDIESGNRFSANNGTAAPLSNSDRSIPQVSGSPSRQSRHHRDDGSAQSHPLPVPLQSVEHEQQSPPIALQVGTPKRAQGDWTERRDPGSAPDPSGATNMHKKQSSAHPTRPIANMAEGLGPLRPPPPDRPGPRATRRDAGLSRPSRLRPHVAFIQI